MKFCCILESLVRVEKPLGILFKDTYSWKLPKSLFQAGKIFLIITWKVAKNCEEGGKLVIYYMKNRKQGTWISFWKMLSEHAQIRVEKPLENLFKDTYSWKLPKNLFLFYYVFQILFCFCQNLWPQSMHVYYYQVLPKLFLRACFYPI